MTNYATLGWVFATFAAAAPPPRPVDSLGTFLLHEVKTGTVLIDEKGEVVKTFNPYAYGGFRSPDGRRVACVEADGEADGNSAKIFRMALRPLAGKEDAVTLPLRLGQNGCSTQFIWSSSGRRVLVMENRETQYSLRRYDLDAKTFSDLKLPDGYYVMGWSSDESRLLATSPDNRLCWLSAAATGKPEFLTPDTEVSRDPKLTSDDKWVLFLSGPIPPKGERWALRLTAMELATKKRIVLDDPGETWGHCWSRDDKRVAYTWQKAVPQGTTATDFETILYTCDRDGKNRQAVTSRKNKTDRPMAGPVLYFWVEDWK
jgi:Tol biopolymer transport system component